MARIVGIDYGTKRSGIAVTDELQLIASGLTTVETPKLLDFLINYCSTENVEVIVVGEPKRHNNEASESESAILAFLLRLEKAMPEMPIKRVDERFTSKIAFQTMIDSGLKKKQRQNKSLIDEISATLILQSYLQTK